MAWEKNLQDKGDKLLNRFESYHQQLQAERKARSASRRHRVFAVDRTVALMIDFGIILLLFSGTLLDASADGTALAGILAAGAQDPNFTSQQAAHAIAQSGLLRSWVAVSLTQISILAVMVLPSLYYLQATPGMFLLGLRIRHEDRVTKPGFWRCLSFFLWGALLLAPFMISFLGLYFRTDHRAWHDVLSHTTIMRKRTIKYEHEQAMLREIEEAEEASRGTAAE